MNIPKMTISYLNPVQPSFLILFVTSRCNARCGFCFYADEVGDSSRKTKELSTDEFEKISKKSGNIPYLLLSGGEPVLRDDLFDIIGFFIENAGAQFITVPSNGLSPERTIRLFDRLTKHFPQCHFRADFSVDFDDENHDISRGVDGCLGTLLKTTDGINELKKKRKNLTLDVVSVYLNSPNQNHERLRDWVRKNISPDNHELHLLRPEWPEVTIDGLDNQTFLEELARYRSESLFKENRAFSPFFRGLNSMYIKGLETVMNGGFLTRCTAGRKITVISETGKVRLCEIRDEVLGDLRENDYDLKAVLRKARDRADSITGAGCSCTWECAISTNIVCNLRFVPALIAETLRYALVSRRKSR